MTIHAPASAVQYLIAFVPCEGVPCEGTLLTSLPLVVHQDPEVLLWNTALWLFSQEPALFHGIVLSRVSGLHVLHQEVRIWFPGAISTIKGVGVVFS